MRKKKKKKSKSSKTLRKLSKKWKRWGGGRERVYESEYGANTKWKICKELI
jgi:hypothetical protein